MPTSTVAMRRGVRAADFEQFAQVVKQFADYWFTVVVLPRRGT